jgi:hypothetical protein
MARLAGVLTLVALLQAQRPTVVRLSGGTMVMSPTVVATWFPQQQPDGSDQLKLLVLWRGSPGWFLQPGSIRGDKARQIIQYGTVRLTLDYSIGSPIAVVNGTRIPLGAQGTDNVLYVDNVDAPAGLKLRRTGHIPERMPGSGQQLGVAIRDSKDVVDYLQCHARSESPRTQAYIERLCLVNLGRE